MICFEGMPTLILGWIIRQIPTWFSNRELKGNHDENGNLLIFS
jgi:hypothetical protein